VGLGPARLLDQQEDPEDQRPGDEPDDAVEEGREQGAGEALHLLDLLGEAVDPGEPVGQDAAAHQEHGDGAGDGEELHQVRGAQQDGPTKGRDGALPPAEGEPRVVQLHDGGDEAVDADGHHHPHRAEDHHLLGEGRRGDGAEGDHDDLRGQHEVGADRPLDLLLLDLLGGLLGGLPGRLGGLAALLGGDLGGLLLRRVEELVGQLLAALEAEERPADHQQGGDRPGGEPADRQRRRHQDQLVHRGALGHRPDHRQLAVRVDAGDLLRVERQVIPQHPRGLLGGYLGHRGHVVEDRGDVVEEGEEACTGQREAPFEGDRSYPSANLKEAFWPGWELLLPPWYLF
jgi:hypothetical protein